MFLPSKGTEERRLFKHIMTDLLTGVPARKISQFCLPLLVGNLFQQLYSMADSMIVGRFMGTQAFAGVSGTGSLNFLIIGFVLGLCSGFSIPAAQDFGAGDMRGVRRAVAHCLWLGLALTGLLTALMFFLTDDLLNLLQTPAELWQYEYDYIHVIFTGMGVTMLYNMLAGILRAVGDSRTPLMFLILSCLINIALDLLFIGVLQMGVSGAAWATLCSQLISGLLCLWYMIRRFPRLIPHGDEWKPDGLYAGRLLKNGLPMGLQFSITAIGSVTMTAAVNGLGVNAVAAVGAASRVHNILTCPMDALGVGMATFSSQNLGARRMDRVRAGVRQMMGIGMAYSLISCAVLGFFGRTMATLFVSASETEVLDLTARYLMIDGFFFPSLLVIFVLRNSLQGLGYSREAMLAGVFELFGRVGVASLLVGRYGFTAACFASPAAWVAADILLLTLYWIKMGHLVKQEKALGHWPDEKAGEPARRQSHPLRSRKTAHSMAK